MRDICRSCNVYTDVVVMRGKDSRSDDILINYFKCNNCGAKRFINYTSHDIIYLKEKLELLRDMYSEMGGNFLDRYEISRLNRKINNKIVFLQMKVNGLR